MRKTLAKILFIIFASLIGLVTVTFSDYIGIAKTTSITTTTEKNGKKCNILFNKTLDFSSFFRKTLKIPYYFLFARFKIKKNFKIFKCDLEIFVLVNIFKSLIKLKNGKLFSNSKI